MLLYKEQLDFLDNCIHVVDTLGTPVDGSIEYVSDVIHISYSNDGSDMRVYRGQSKQLIVLIQDGKVVGFDMDYIFLVDYVASLVDGVDS